MFDNVRSGLLHIANVGPLFLHFRVQHGPLPALSDSKKEQRTRLKRHLDQGLIKNMAVAPKFYKHGKKLAGIAKSRNGQESNVHKNEARSHKVPQEQGSSQGTQVPSQQREWAILPDDPVTLEQQPMVSLSRPPRGQPARQKRFSSVTLQPSATPGPLLLQPQVPNATKQDSAVAVLEWQRQLEAAEALLALKNSSQHPGLSASLQHPGGMPGH
ncbi:Doublesex- and mab-3-related transcription factor C1 [Lemmus lemmus]